MKLVRYIIGWFAMQKRIRRIWRKEKKFLCECERCRIEKERNK